MIRGKNNNSKLTLQYAQKCLAFMGFKRNQRLNGRLLIGLLFPFLNVFLNIMFVLYEAKTFWEYTNSIFVCLVNSVGFLLFAILIVQVWRVFEIIDFGQTFFERKIKCSATRKIYFKTNAQAEKWSKIVHFILAQFIPIAFMLPKPILSYFMYFTTDLGPDAFELTFPVWVPYDWRNPIGYLATTIFQYISLQRFLGFLGLAAALGAGALIFGMNLIRDMKTILKSTNGNALDGDQNKMETRKKLHEFIELHAMVKEKMIFYSDTMEPFAAVTFVSSLATICCAMLMIQMELSINSANSLVMLLIAFVYALYSFGLLFIGCEIGQSGCDAVNSFDMDFGQIDWYLYPIEMQKMLPTVMIMAQKPVQFKWFGSSAADRDTFKNICNKGYSFFMVLRGFSK